MPLIFDAHEDIAWNILTFGRDYTRAADETRRLETASGSLAPRYNGETLLGWPDYQRGGVAVVFGTLFAAPERCRMGEWDTQVYGTYADADRIYRAQAEAYYHLFDHHAEKFRLVTARTDLATVLSHWDSSPAPHPVGLVILMEGAEGVQTPAELDEWWKLGVRIIGPAWVGTRFCGGTREPGALTDDGRALLEEMDSIGFILDLSHMDELAAQQSLDFYPGAIIASHANAAACLVGYDGNRLLSEAVIKGIVARDGVIGVVPFCRFLKAGWKRGDGRAGLTLETLAVHIDYICQLAGNARHVGLGSDFDGGFGLDSAPADVNTVADLQRLGPLLTGRGYTEADLAAILGGNWLRSLKESLPA